MNIEDFVGYRKAQLDQTMSMKDKLLDVLKLLDKTAEDPTPYSEEALVNNIAIKVKDLLEKVEELEEDSNFLDALRGAGVDNWDGYDYALELLNEGDEE